MQTYPILLKEWRKRRRLSQLDLALEADVSARHISFLETGRAQPSRQMIAQLSDVMAVPQAAQNQMMRAVGFAPRFAATPLEDSAMAAIEEAVAWTLDRHAPYPGIAVSRTWQVRRMNAPAKHLFAGLGITEGNSLLDLLSDPHMPEIVENWPEFAHHAVLRLRAESAAAGGLPELDRAAEALAPMAKGPTDLAGPTVPTVYRFNGRRLALFATLAHFTTAADETVDDLRMELFFPADQDSAAFLRALADQR